MSGLPGHNIPLDLQKEHDNKDIKCETWEQTLMREMLKEQLALCNQDNMSIIQLTETVCSTKSTVLGELLKS